VILVSVDKVVALIHELRSVAGHFNFMDVVLSWCFFPWLLVCFARW
jgi:hypothetical protein